MTDPAAIDPRVNRTTTGAGHPDTSHDAAARVFGLTGGTRLRVLHAIADAQAAGCTDEELQHQLSLSANTQRPRRVELVRSGLIAPSPDYRRPTATGSMSTVWVLTHAGRHVLNLIGAP